MQLIERNQRKKERDLTLPPEKLAAAGRWRWPTVSSTLRGRSSTCFNWRRRTRYDEAAAARASVSGNRWGRGRPVPLSSTIGGGRPIGGRCEAARGGEGRRRLAAGGAAAPGGRGGRRWLSTLTPEVERSHGNELREKLVGIRFCLA